MTHASLFSGIGGAELAAYWMGWKNLFHCEIAEFPSKVLSYWFPNSIAYHDIKSTNFTKWGGQVDVLTGGFPCQPFSFAGRRKGTEDDRYLFPEMLRAIGEIRPTWVVGENVSGITTMVQPGSDIEVATERTLFGEGIHLHQVRQEYVIETVCKGFDEKGYSVIPVIIPACGVGAPHKRDRVWFIAHLRQDTHNTNGSTVVRGSKEHEGEGRAQGLSERNEVQQSDIASGLLKHHPHTDINGLEGQLQNQGGSERVGQPKAEASSLNADDARPMGSAANTACPGHPTQEPDRGTQGEGCEGHDEPCQRSSETQRLDGLSQLLWDAFDTECLRRNESRVHDGRSEEPSQAQRRQEQPIGADRPQDWWRFFPTQPPVCGGDDGLPGFVDSLTIPFNKWRQESVKGYGNAWMPQVAYEIFRAIEQVENTLKDK